VGLLLLALPSQAPAQGNARPVAPRYERTVTIQGAQVAGPLKDFPVLVTVSDPTLSRHCRNDAADVAFRRAGDDTALPREIEAFDPSRGELRAWVRIPALEPQQDAELLMSYGAPEPAPGPSPREVWDAQHLLVLHLNEDSGAFRDATGRQNDATPAGSIKPGDKGKVGLALGLDGNGGHVVVKSAASLMLTEAYTISGWFRLNGKTESGENPFFGCDKALAARCVGTTCDFDFRQWPAGGAAWEFPAQKSFMTWFSWYHIAITFQRPRLTLYRNGEIVASADGPDTIATAGRDLWLGALEGSGGGLNGAIDEFTVSDTARSLAWIRTSYNNQNAPATFAAVGPERDPAAKRATDSQKGRGPSLGKPWDVPELNLHLIWIPAGAFPMGSTQRERDWAVSLQGKANPELLKDEGEKPRLTPVNTGFWLGQTEVTVLQWRYFIDATRYKTDAETRGNARCHRPIRAVWEWIPDKNWRDPHFQDTQREDFPVSCISWNDANAFCDWLTQRERAAGCLPNKGQYRLPTEVEWEFACRGGAKKGSLFWWGDSWADAQGRANVADQHPFKPDTRIRWADAQPWDDGWFYVAPVDSYGPKGRNGFGLSDMLGNAWEWCYDVYTPPPGAAEEGADTTLTRRALRGGSFCSDPGYLRCADRGWLFEASATCYTGFRLCLGVTINNP